MNVYLWTGFGATTVLCLVLVWFLIQYRKKLVAANAREDPYKIIAQETGDISFEVDLAENRIHASSDLSAALLDYPPGELPFQPQNFDDLFHKEDLPQLRAAWQGLAHNERMDIEARLRTRTGETCWIQITALPTGGLLGTPNRAVGVIRNTQTLHEEREALAEARRMQTVGTMAAGMAHEFNNHLTPIRGFIELALDYLSADHPVSDGLNTALDRVEYCTELVGQIQAYGRKSLLIKEEMELPKVLPSIIRVAMSTEPDRAKNVSLNRDWPESLPLILADHSQLQQAIVHLVRNALIAMPEGGTLTIRGREISLRQDQLKGRREARSGEFVCLSVQDSGTGIQPHDLEHIFDPFFTTQKMTGARGMGLPMVQGMIAQHNGWMEIRTDPGKGTEVRLFFPIEPAIEKRAPVTDEDGTMAVLPAAPIGKMLVADDEEHIRDLIRRVFEPEGWDVVQACDYDETLRLSGENGETLDLLIVDVTMPGPTPEESIPKLLTNSPGAGFLLISGYAKDERIEKLVSMAHADFLGKPFSPKELLTRVDAILGQRK